MSIKLTKVFYPHIVKQYESVEQLITENGYDDFATAFRGALGEISRQEALSDDGFEAIVTVEYASQEERDATISAIESAIAGVSKSPIYEEEVETHLF